MSEPECRSRGVWDATSATAPSPIPMKVAHAAATSQRRRDACARAAPLPLTPSSVVASDIDGARAWSGPFLARGHELVRAQLKNLVKCPEMENGPPHARNGATSTRSLRTERTRESSPMKAGRANAPTNAQRGDLPRPTRHRTHDTAQRTGAFVSTCTCCVLYASAPPLRGRGITVPLTAHEECDFSDMCFMLFFARLRHGLRLHLRRLRSTLPR